jgi:hypothetical protein
LYPLAHADVSATNDIATLRRLAAELRLATGDLVYAADLQRRHFNRDQLRAYERMDQLHHAALRYDQLLNTFYIDPASTEKAFANLRHFYLRVTPEFSRLHSNRQVDSIVERIDGAMRRLGYVYQMIDVDSGG